MNEGPEGHVGLLPIYAQLPVLLILCFILRIIWRLSRDTSVRFVAVAIWFRLVLSAFHVITYQTVAGGFSINALGSIATVGVGVLLLRKAVLLSTATLPIIPMLVAISLSAFMSGHIPGALDMLVKFSYAMVISAHVFEAVRKGEAKALGQATLLAFSPELLFQVVSIVLGVKNFSSFDGSSNYIGGYNHEGGFSVALFGMISVAALVQEVPFRQRVVAMGLGTVGLLFANYRTAIVASGPVIMYFAVLLLNRGFPNRVRLLVSIAFGIMIVTAAFSVITSSEKFEGIGETVERLSHGLPAPAEFTSAEKDLLTGRVFLWASYYESWKNGDSVVHLTGRGPESWSDEFRLYGHNSFVHYLYELGLVGEGAMLFLIVSLMTLGLLSPARERWGLLSVVSGFVFLNCATLPMWQVEGLLAFGLILGLAAASVSLKRKMPYEPLETEDWRIAAPPGAHALPR